MAYIEKDIGVKNFGSLIFYTHDQVFAIYRENENIRFIKFYAYRALFGIYVENMSDIDFQ